MQKMKLDNNPAFSHPSSPRKSYNPFDSDDDLLDTSVVDALPFHMNNGDFPWEEAILVHPSVVESAKNVDGSNDKDLFVKETGLYADKNVMECIFPELIVCIKENSYHQSVKDICIDEGVPSKDKIRGRSNCGELKSSADDNSQGDELAKEKDLPETIHDSAKGGLFSDERETDHSIVKGAEESVSVHGLISNERQKNHPDTAVNEDWEVFEKFAAINTPPPSVLDDPGAEIKSTESHSDEAILPSPSSKSTLNRSSLNSVDHEKEEEGKMPCTDEKPPETQSMSRDTEGGIAGNVAYVSLEQHFLGETSFSSRILPPSSISYDGPIAYSANLSLRSESSAGSTRSFAFPVLQTEWHGSPERMAKPDREHLRKHRGWLQALICCPDAVPIIGEHPV
ncbi:hypothetical protein Dimus_031226 [Dionaea muscipula]